MLDDLTPEEVVAIVHITRVADTAPSALIFVGDVFHTLDSVPGVQSLAKKVNQAGEREDVKTYLREVYGEYEKGGES